MAAYVRDASTVRAASENDDVGFVAGLIDRVRAHTLRSLAAPDPRVPAWRAGQHFSHAGSPGGVGSRASAPAAGPDEDGDVDDDDVSYEGARSRFMAAGLNLNLMGVADARAGELQAAAAANAAMRETVERRAADDAAAAAAAAESGRSGPPQLSPRNFAAAALAESRAARAEWSALGPGEEG
jgi:hypothetical protein